MRAPPARTWLPALPGLALLALLLGPLLDPVNVLTGRDIPFFHLPLRATFKALLSQGLPEWNPLIHSGQPILSNPNYAAFYPPTWLALAVPMHFGISLLVVGHALFAFAGAWRLQRYLGGGPAAAGLAATAFAGGTWFVSLSSTLNFFCGMAWFPWILTWGLAVLDAPDHRLARRPGVLCAVGLGLQLLAGEPVAVLISGGALVCLAASTLRATPGRLFRLVPIAILAAGVASVQLLSTADRIQGSSRADGVQYEMATTWSAPPLRLIDIALPRLWGDPNRDEEGFYFGWGLHDRDFPYLVALYVGLLPLCLALGALGSRHTPYRWGWLLAAGPGLFIALGRHNPLYELVQALPVVGLIRYPEKFLALTVAVLPFLGGLGWETTIASRSPGTRRTPATPAVAAIALALIGAALSAVLLLSPTTGERFIRVHSGLEPSPTTVQAGLEYLRTEALVATAVAGATALLLVLVGQRGATRSLALAAVSLLAVELWHYGRYATPVLPVGQLSHSPSVASVGGGFGDRIFTDVEFDRRPEISLRQGPVGYHQVLGRLDRLDPYSGNLWGLSYALHADFDLMLTSWGRHALTALRNDLTGQGLHQLTGAWNAGHLITRRAPDEIMADLRRGDRPRPFLVLQNPALLPRYRVVRRLEFDDDRSSAMERIASRDFDVSEIDIAVGPRPRGWPTESGPGRLVDAREQGKLITLEYERGPLLVVAAVTYDAGWSATTNSGHRLEIRPTGLGQMVLSLPPGNRIVSLAFRDDTWIGGGLLTLVSILVAIAVFRRSPYN